MSSRPDSPWHYVQAFYALVKARTKLHLLIRFIGRTESADKCESDNEEIKQQLDGIEQELDFVRRNIDEETNESNLNPKD